MLIANPIYDVVFKRLMENERVAKFFVGTMLGQKVVSLELKPQEFTYADELVGIAVFRLDFIAIIETETGEHKKILIEIQKAKNDIDLMRFRNYLAEQYKKEDTINGEETALPITTIYILGFKLPEIETACIHVKRRYLDMINNAVLDKKSPFVERLTHDSYVVQVGRITGRYQSKLDKLLSVFEQNHFTENTEVVKDFPHPADDADVRVMTAILHHAGTNPTERKEIEREAEAWRSINALFARTEKELRKKLENQQQELESQQQELENQQQELESQQQELESQQQELENKDEKLAEMQKLIEELKRKLNKQQS